MSTAQPPVLNRFFKLLSPDRKDIVYIYLYAVCSGLLTLSLPLGVQAVLGMLIGQTLSNSLFILIGAVTAGTVFAGILQVMQLTVTESIQRRIYSRSAYEFALRIPRLRLRELDEEYIPEWTNRFFDTLTIQKGLPKVLVDLSSSVLQIIFGLLLISFYHPFFVFFGFILLVILFLIFRITGPMGMRTSLVESKYKYKLAHWLQEMARAIVTFKLSGSERMALDRTQGLVDNYLDNRGKHFRVLVFQYGTIVVFKGVITAVLLGLGSYLVIQNQISLGQFVAAEIVVLLILASVEKLIISMDTIYDLLTGVEKIGQFTDLPLEPQNGMDFKRIDRPGEAINISIRDLSFGYPNSQQPVLNQINLEIKAGEKVCIAGPNGSGKSTLVQLAAGLHLDYSGSILYNGIPASNINLRSLRQRVSYQGSPEHLFRGSLLDNLTLGMDDLDMESVIRSAEATGLSRLVEQLPDGYATDLMPGGRNLSEHFCTLILLTRALVTRPCLLTLERTIQRMEGLQRGTLMDLLLHEDTGWTLLAISSDPELARRCDRVVILQKGSIVAQGHYTELEHLPAYQAVFNEVNLPDNA